MIRPGGEWVTLDAAAARVGRSRRTLDRWVAQGRISVYFGRVDVYGLLVAERSARMARCSARGVVAGQHAND